MEFGYCQHYERVVYIFKLVDYSDGSVWNWKKKNIECLNTSIIEYFLAYNGPISASSVAAAASLTAFLILKQNSNMCCVSLAIFNNLLKKKVKLVHYNKFRCAPQRIAHLEYSDMDSGGT